jgi:hypothetical protein
MDDLKDAWIENTVGEGTTPALRNTNDVLNLFNRV